VPSQMASVSLLIVLLASASAPCAAPPASPAPPAPEVTWQVIVPDRPAFTAALAEGEAMWTPPSERLWITRRVDGKADATAALKPGPGFRAAGGAEGGRHGDSWVLRAPRTPGAYALTTMGGRTFYLLVLTPARMVSTKTRDGQKITLYMGRRSIGVYPDPTAADSRRVRGAAGRYLPPLWFFAFDAKTQTIPLSKHLKVGDMVGFLGRGRARKRRGKRHAWYFPPSRALVRKIEAIAEVLEKKGVKVGGGLVVTSAFRTPAHNRKAGGAPLSRHCYGDSADVIIDRAPLDGRMDDLNGDGRIDARDGLIIANAAREAELAGNAIPGGIGLYEYIDPESVGCHVHIDARGYVTRWGTTYKTGRARKLRWWPEGEFPEDEEEK